MNRFPPDILIQLGGSIWRRAVGYALFTAFIGVPLILAAQHLLVIRSLYASTSSDSSILRTFGFIFEVGPMEETCKAIPLVLFGLRERKIEGIHDGLFLGLMCSRLSFA